MTIFNTMNRLEKIYQDNEGDIHKIINNYMLTQEEFEYVVELKGFYNPAKNK